MFCGVICTQVEVYIDDDSLSIGPFTCMVQFFMQLATQFYT